MSNLAPAPGGLRFVQDLVNTAAGHRPDPRAAAGQARAWLRGALAAWSAATGSPAPAIELDDGDLPALRGHRELLRETLRARARPEPGPGPGADPRPGPGFAAGLLLTGGREVAVGYEPFESGWRAIRALASAETLLAQA